MKAKSLLFLSITFLLFGCSQEPEQAPPLETSEIRRLFEADELDQAIRAFKIRERQGIARKDDYLLAIELYEADLDGIGMELAIEKVHTYLAPGDDKSELEYQQAKALFLQGQYTNAGKLLDRTVSFFTATLEEALLRADIYAQLKRYDDAEKWYKKALEIEPLSHQGRIGLAQTTFAQGNLTNAEAEITEALAIAPDNVRTLTIAGNIKRLVNKVDEAREHLQKAIALSPRNTLALLELAAIHIQTGDSEAANAALDAVFAISPQNTTAQFYTGMLMAQEGREQEGWETMIRFPRLLESDPLAAKVFGLVSYRLGKTAEACRWINRVTPTFSSDRTLVMSNASCLMREAKYGEAYRILSQIIEAEPENIDANMLATSASFYLGAPAVYREHLTRTIALIDPSDEKYRTKWQVFQYQLGALDETNGLSRDEVISNLQEAYEGAENEIIPQILLANLHIENRDFEAAGAIASKYLENHPEDAQMLTVQGTVYLYTGRMDEGLARYDAALELDPGLYSTYKRRGVVYLAKQDFYKALDDLEKYIAVVPQDAQARALYARALLETGDAEQAITHFIRSEEDLPNAPILQADYSEALAATGRYDRAIEKAEHARTLGASNAALVEYLDKLVKDWQATVAAQEKAKEDREAERRLQQEKEQAEQEALKKKLQGIDSEEKEDTSERGNLPLN